MYLWLVIPVFVFCFVLFYTSTIFGSFYSPYKNLAPLERVRWDYWVVTIVQNLVSFPLAVYVVGDAIWNYTNTEAFYLQPSTFAGGLVNALVLGHAFFDWVQFGVHYYQYGYSGDPSLMLHHLCIVIVMPIVMATVYLAAQILHEGSSPCISMRAMLYYIDYHQTTFAAINHLVLYCWLLVCHDLVNLLTLAHILFNFSAFIHLVHPCVSAAILIGFTIIALLGSLWTYAFHVGAVKKYRSLMKRM